MADETKITALDNGPYLVKGPMKVLDAEGSEFRVERRTVALCRCGGSTTKPFCDGTHSKTGLKRRRGRFEEMEVKRRTEDLCAKTRSIGCKQEKERSNYG